VAIVGPPNSGKSTLFNRLTGLRQKVANFPGVTVEQRIGQARLDANKAVTVVDLPGVYSLSPRSEDEQVTFDVLQGCMEGVSKPDAILLILDATNLGRHLVLARPCWLSGSNSGDPEHGGRLARRARTLDVEALATTGRAVTLISASAARASTRCSSSWAALGYRRRWNSPSSGRAATGSGRDALETGRRITPAPPLDTPSGCDLSPSLKGPIVFGLVVVAVFQSIFPGRGR
jgi:ferrous iron transport protein B